MQQATCQFPQMRSGHDRARLRDLLVSPFAADRETMQMQMPCRIPNTLQGGRGKKNQARFLLGSIKTAEALKAELIGKMNLRVVTEQGRVDICNTVTMPRIWGSRMAGRNRKT
jgi:hypothetical protein